MKKLEGKVALITGGTTGIGAAAAKLFQSEGATVIVTGSTSASVEAAKADMPGIQAVISNQADVAASESLVAGIVAEHGRIDILVANAGTARFLPADDVDPACLRG